MFEIITIDELLKRLDKYSHKELHIHHTYSPSHKDFNGSNGIALQQAMKNYHVNTRHWQDIAQHVTLLPNGLFVTGRDFAKTPASITGHNTGGFAVEMLGNFDIGHDKLQGEQRESIIKLAKYFDDKKRYIRFHRENSPKTCPGTSINKAEFMAEVKQYGLIKKIEKVVDGMNIKTLQHVINVLGIKDNSGNALAEDGKEGSKTKEAKAKLKEILVYVLK